MGQSNSRSTGHTPLVGTSSIDNDNNGGVTHDAACPSNQAVDEPMSADSEDHSARLPREASSLTQLDLASNLTTAIETHHRGSLDGLASQQTISAATSNSASALAAESSTPPLCHTPSPPTQTSIMSSYDATAPPDDLSDSNTCTSRLSEIESSKRPGNQDGSGKQAAPENHAREPARIQRRTLAERLRNVRRRSSQRLSWALHGRNRSSEGPIEDPSPTSGHTAQLTERQEPLAASQSTLSTPSSSSHIVPTSSSMTEVSSDNASAPAAGTRDPWRVMTPPPEEDLMFEERQRARRMVQEALAQLQNELARPGASRVPIAEDQVQQQELGQVRAPTLTTGPQLPGTLDGMGQSSQPGIARQSPGDQNSVIQSDNARQRLMEESEPLVSLPSRILAPLPRRSASRSTSPPATPTHAVESRPHMFEDLFPNPTLPSTPPAISAASSAAHQPAPNVSSRSSRDLMIPRRILVQGIVSSSPPPPASISSSRPMTANPSRASVGDDAPDMALWNELPGIETVQPHTQEPSLSRRRSASLAEGASANAGGDDWENAISAALAQRSRDAAEDPANMLREQANLIGRLLCVAAAATAATLIPGITVNGSSVAGFGESQGGDLLSGTGIPLGPAPPTQRTTESVGSTRPRSDSFGTFRTQRRDSESDMPTPDTTTAAASTNGSPPSSALREILSNALAAAFRSAPSGSTQSSPLSGTSGGPPVVSSPLGESSFSSTSIRPPSNNIHPLTTAPSAFPEPATAVPPPQPRRSLSDPFGHGTALAIPVASLRAGIPYVSGDHHPTGTFERFLADLQADVSAAILRSRQNSDATAPSRSNANRRSSATGLEEMRPLLDDIDEVRSEVVSEDLHTEPGTSASPSTPGQTSAERRPFSFFRSYRFPPRPAVGATDSAATAAGAGNESATPTSPQSAEEPQTSVPTEDVVMDGEENAPADAHPLSTPLSTPAPQHASSGDARTASPPSPGRQMVPMLLVGVRSASLLGLPGADSNTTGPSPDTPRPGQSFDEPMSEASASNSFGSPVDNASGNHTRPSGERESGSSGFVLWILGGLYPANHPIVIAPSLLGDDSTSYEELLRLAEVLGNVKPPTVSKEEIKKSDLKVVKSQTIAELYANGSVREITSERCLVCLEDYEDGEDVRILNCKHCFHQGCVDTWLSTGANTCPACRTVGVTKDGDIPAAEIPQAAAV